MINYVTSPCALEQLVEEHRKNNKVIRTYKLHFDGASGYDVYNVCQEFNYNGKCYIAGRVEKRDSEISNVVLFEKISDGEYKATDITFPMMQDPCQCVIDGELIIGGTRIYQDANGQINNWHTSFFRGNDVKKMTHFADATPKMKDVRIIKTDKVHVFTRPQGGAAKGGRIGYVAVDLINQVGCQSISNAVMLDSHFADECWGGVNQVHVLSNGKLGVVGHIAKMSAGNVRHYYGMVFCFDPVSKQSTRVKIICERKDFAPGSYKREDLIDVVFCGGLVRNGDKTANIYVGLSDAESHCAVIEDPFTEYEEEV